MRAYILTLLASACLAGSAEAQSNSIFVPGPHGGGAAYADEQQQQRNEPWGFAGAYRAGDYVYLSGVVTGARGGEPIDAETFKENLRVMFERAEETLNAAGASLEEVVDIVSFHIWDTPLFEGDKFEHIGAVAEVKKEFMPAPHPAWTAIGVSELLPNSGLIEVRMIAYSPQDE